MKIIPPAIYLSGDDELLHKAMVLVGDQKALAIERLRILDTHYKGQMQDIINYIISLYNEVIEDNISAWKRHVDSIKTVKCPIRIDALVYAPLSILIGKRPFSARNPSYIPITDKRIVHELSLTTVTMNELDG